MATTDQETAARLRDQIRQANEHLSGDDWDGWITSHILDALAARRESPAPGLVEAARNLEPGSPAHVALWDAINDYATACHGDPSKHVYGNTARQRAVAAVERSLRAALPEET